jgi:N utilization substance protein B
MRSPRRRAREFALQGLYQWLLTGQGAGSIGRDLAELDEHGAADLDFLERELAGVIASADELRALLEPLADRKWEEVSPVERAILMIGGWELLRLPEVPYRVAINESIELAKRFGGTEGHRYVNGILDRVAAQLRPGEIAAGRTAEGKPRQNAGRASRAAPAKKADA